MTTTIQCHHCGDAMAEHETEPRCRYNGWRNYETWAVKLWLDNEQGSYNRALEHAREAKKDADSKDPADAKYYLSDILKLWISECMPDIGSSMWADLLNSAFQEIDWQEIAEAYLEEVKEQS